MYHFTLFKKSINNILLNIFLCVPKDMPATSLGSRAYDSGVNNFISRSRTHKITATNETQDAAVACGEG